MPGQIFYEVKVVKEVEENDYVLRFYNIGIAVLFPPYHKRGIDITKDWAHYVQDLGRDDEKFLHEFLNREDNDRALMKRMWPGHDICT